MKKFSLLCAALLAMATCHHAWATPTVIAGIARNGTDKKQPLSGATVQLVRPGDKGAKTTVVTTATDAQGHFSFPARDYSSSDLLMVSITHQGFDYWSVAYDGGGKLKSVGITVNPKQVDVLVFDSTTQPVPLTFQVHHLAIESTPSGLKCIERIVVHNSSPRTLMGVGPRQISVLLDIPEAAKDVKLDPSIADAKILKTQDGWGIVKPITPDAYGVRNALILSYNMDWPSALPWAKSVDLSRKTIYPTQFFFVARTEKDKDLQVSAPKLSADAEAPVPIDGQTQTRLVNSIGAPMMPQGADSVALPAGQEISITVSKPVSSLFWGFAALTVGLCLFLPLALIKPRSKAALSGVGPKFAEPPHSALVSEQTSAMGGQFGALNGFGIDLALTSESRALIQKIADLDDKREAGQIGEAEYQNLRVTWKKQLIESLGSPPTH